MRRSAATDANYLRGRLAPNRQRLNMRAMKKQSFFRANRSALVALGALVVLMILLSLGFGTAV